MMDVRPQSRARDPAANHGRAWRIEARRDLLGDWTADVPNGASDEL